MGKLSSDPLDIMLAHDEWATRRLLVTCRGPTHEHPATHNAGHRSQCVNMLRHLGAPGISDALPELGVVEWRAEVELPPAIGS